MKYLRYFVRFVLSGICLTGLSQCRSDSEQSDQLDYTLTDSYSLPVPDDASSVFRSAQYDDQNKILYVLSSVSNKVYVYDIQKKSIKKEMKFEKEGPDGVGKVFSFYLISPDSILLTPSYNYTYFLTNAKGKLLQSYRILRSDVVHKPGQGPPTNGYSVLPRGGFEAPCQKIGNMLYISGVPDVDPDEAGFCQKAKPAIQYNIQTKTVAYAMQYPQVYCDNIYPIQNIGVYFKTFNPDTKRFIYSFPADNNLVEVNLDGNQVRTHLAKSKSFARVNPMPHQVEDPRKQYEHYIKNGSYERVCYDKYRKLYYRFVLHPDENQTEDGGKMFFPVWYSIIILDSSFHIKGEIKLPNAYKYGYFYCDKKGLYLQKNTTNEDRYEFGLLTVNIK